MVKRKWLILPVLLASCNAEVTVPAGTSTSTTVGTTSTLPVVQTTSTTVLGQPTLPKRTTTTTVPEVWRRRVVAVGDMVCSRSSTDTCAHEDTALLAEFVNPDAVLALGDLQYESGSYDAFMEMYDPTWGRLKDITYPVPGNHEYYTPGAAGYAEYFGLSQFYYAFDMGMWRLAALDSESNIRDQATFLDQQLSDEPSCVIAYWHRPRYSSGVHGNYSGVEPFVDLLPEGSIVLSGHDHHYERVSVDGITHFVVGTGGKNVRSVGRSNSDFVYDDSAGMLVIDLYEGWYEWAFITNTGLYLDKGSGVCAPTS